MQEMNFIAPAGGRVDAVLAGLCEQTRSQVERLVKEGNLTVNGQTVIKPSFAVREGDALRLRLPDPVPTDLVPQDIPLDIVYEDDDLAVVYKPSGMTVHPGAGMPDGTMANALLFALDGVSTVGGVERPGIVHRIDKDTSGLLLVAKNDKAHLSLSEQIAAHTCHRVYLALCYGRFKQTEDTINAPLGRSPKDRKKMAIVPGGKEAVTHYRVLEQFESAALVECRLETGRTHQIRVHMTSIGHPLLGDEVYGPKRPPFSIEGGQLLHAARIGFVHPSTGEEMVFEAPPEARFTLYLDKLRKK